MTNREAEIHQLRPKPVAVNWMCSACGVDASCNCGAALMSKAGRAREIKEANPERSNKSIGRELDMDATQVRKALNKGVSHDTPDEEEDGDEGHEEGLRVIAARGFLNRAEEAKKICTIGKLHASDITEAMIEAADDAAAAWHRAAQHLREKRQYNG